MGRGAVWAIDILGQATLGARWDVTKAVLALLAGVLEIAMLLYGFDIFLRPFVWSARVMGRAWRRLHSRPEAGPPALRRDELDWRAPARGNLPTTTSIGT